MSLEDEQFYYWISAAEKASYLFRPEQGTRTPDIVASRTLRNLAVSWQQRLESAGDDEDASVQAYASALGDCADELLALIMEHE